MRAPARRTPVAAGLGVSIAIEMHQHSIADNSWSTLHLLDLIGLPNVGCNPDLGNLYWCYEEPEESVERCIVALAPRAKYWHCKQLIRVHVPEVQKAYYIKVPLPDGDMDYRFAVAAMFGAGYTGAMAIEGVREGDQMYRDGKSAEYWDRASLCPRCRSSPNSSLRSTSAWFPLWSPGRALGPCWGMFPPAC
ncbi:MAG: sugar phosphate isomerase/epimerase [Chloroflexi bacterium]|nr:sugar phosphate isomerase/epimerase [Chloroflexota bacterium]